MSDIDVSEILDSMEFNEVDLNDCPPSFFDEILQDVLDTLPNPPASSTDLVDRKSPSLKLEIVEEPNKHFEFSSEVFIKSNKGQLLGGNSTKYKKSYIRLRIKEKPQDVDRIQVLCLLCPYIRNEENSWHIDFFPILSTKLLINNATEKDIENSKNCMPIVLDMLQEGTTVTDLEVKSLHIMRSINPKLSLMKAYQNLWEWHKGELKENEKTIIENKAAAFSKEQEKNEKLRLCFIPFYENHEGKQFGEPTFTKYFTDYLPVNKIHPVCVKVSGQEKVVIKTRKTRTTFQANIHIYEEAADGRMKWEKLVENVKFQQDNELHFEAPPYDGPYSTMNRTINCYIQIICHGEERKSNPVRFVYVNGDVSIKLPRQRKRKSELTIYTDSTDSSHANTDASNEDEEVRLEAWKNFSDTKAGLLDLEEKINFYRYLNEDYYKESGECLLHDACKRNHLADNILDLVRTGGMICTQDYKGRTPLHIAIKYKKTDCIAIFAKLFQHYDNYATDIIDEMKQLFTVYDTRGYTAMQRAVLQNLPSLVDNMLRFCMAHNIDVCAIEVLGSGDTIMHLAVSAKMKDMEKLILQHIPNADGYVNYEGLTAYEANTKLLEQMEQLKL